MKKLMMVLFIICCSTGFISLSAFDSIKVRNKSNYAIKYKITFGGVVTKEGTLKKGKNSQKFSNIKKDGNKKRVSTVKWKLKNQYNIFTGEWSWSKWYQMNYLQLVDGHLDFDITM